MTMTLRFRALQSPLFKGHTTKKDIFILFSIESLRRYELDLSYQVWVFYATRLQGAIIFLNPVPRMCSRGEPYGRLLDRVDQSRGLDGLSMYGQHRVFHGGRRSWMI